MKQESRRIYPHMKKGRFYNHPNELPKGFFFHSFLIYLKSFINQLFYHPLTHEWRVEVEPILRSTEPLITWIGHSTFLIQMAGINILTDPIFGDSTALFPRILDPGIRLNKLPPIDYVLISHNHLDHMDAQALAVLKQLNPHCLFLVPLGDKKWFDQREYANAREYTWWEQESFRLLKEERQEIRFTFLPAYHWSQRNFFDKNKSLWGSWMIECAGVTIYFGGDTGYSRHFKAIGHEFDHVDFNLCLLQSF